MDRINQIINHKTYRHCLKQIRDLEKDRIFCGHDMAHFLDVARLAYLISLEEGLAIPKERIYATALLHDIGRHIQYLEGTPHQEASLPIAEEILKDCGFEEEEREDILTAIRRHRDPQAASEPDLSGLIYRADKLSRSCFGCQAEPQCDWSARKKNLELTY
ncbi:MAG: HD domain-containing protein [Candidatus Limivivens sp.]|nr:HD domain-containing protein [Candidatus Limivivens sp.]